MGCLRRIGFEEGGVGFRWRFSLNIDIYIHVYTYSSCIYICICICSFKVFIYLFRKSLVVFISPHGPPPLPPSDSFLFCFVYLFVCLFNQHFCQLFYMPIPLFSFYSSPIPSTCLRSNPLLHPLLLIVHSETGRLHMA